MLRLKEISFSPLLAQTKNRVKNRVSRALIEDRNVCVCHEVLQEPATCGRHLRSGMGSVLDKLQDVEGMNIHRGVTVHCAKVSIAEVISRHTGHVSFLPT